MIPGSRSASSTCRSTRCGSTCGCGRRTASGAMRRSKAGTPWSNCRRSGVELPMAEIYEDTELAAPLAWREGRDRRCRHGGRRLCPCTDRCRHHGAVVRQRPLRRRSAGASGASSRACSIMVPEYFRAPRPGIHGRRSRVGERRASSRPGRVRASVRWWRCTGRSARDERAGQGAARRSAGGARVAGSTKHSAMRPAAGRSSAKMIGGMGHSRPCCWRCRHHKRPICWRRRTEPAAAASAAPPGWCADGAVLVGHGRLRGAACRQRAGAASGWRSARLGGAQCEQAGPG